MPRSYTTVAVPSAAPQAAATLRLQHLARHVHRLGERPTSELLAAIGRRVGYGVVIEEAEQFARLKPDVVSAMRADRLPGPLLDVVPGSRR